MGLFILIRPACGLDKMVESRFCLYISFLRLSFKSRDQIVYVYGMKNEERAQPKQQ